MYLYLKSSTAYVEHCLLSRSQQIPDDHLAGCDIYAEADSPRRNELRPEGAGLPNTDFLLYLHTQATDKCRAEVKKTL